jgi:hypothetical protein
MGLSLLCLSLASGQNASLGITQPGAQFSALLVLSSISAEFYRRGVHEGFTFHRDRK